MTYKYISLPIELASDELMSRLHNSRSNETLLVSYIIDIDVLGFSSIISEKGTEYLCESEEEFHKLVGEYRLLRML